MSWLRLLVLWIATIAVPFQAAVAVTMPMCGAEEGRGGRQAANDHDHDHEHGHAHGVASHDHGGPDGADPAHPCATCGACHATALTGVFSMVVFHALPPADLAEPSVAMATPMPRLPERPPRG